MKDEAEQQAQTEAMRKDITLRQLARSFKGGKAQEGYVVSRIYHRVGREDLKLITQQAVRCPEKNGNHPYRTDAYFPQLGIHVEVDEPAHQANVDADRIREEHIVSATSHDIERVDTSRSLSMINGEIDKIVTRISDKISRQEKNDSWEVWDPFSEFLPERYWKKNPNLIVGEHEGFLKAVDAIRCLGGHHYKGFQRGGVKHPMRDSMKRHANETLWFPRLFPHRDWDNHLVEHDDGSVEIVTLPTPENQHYDENQWKVMVDNFKGGKTIVFARERDSLNRVLYVFRGVFRLNPDRCREEQKEIYERIAVEIPIYPE